jgi:tetratricopeptide (TPR) repeat protein
MALNYWGWTGDRDDVARVIKPGVPNNPDFIQAGKPDKNVMPLEMTDFVNEQTQFKAILRIGGEIELLKNLLANGFPVVIEKGYYEADYTGKIAWLGHYLFVTGYDEAEGAFIVQDAYLKPGKNLKSDYESFIEGWRSFNYTFFVVYTPADEAKVIELLGPWADINWARQHALDLANQDIQTTTGIDEFFSWFNKGSSHSELTQYNDSAFAYDQAFLLYSQLGGDDTQRPYRIMWYQTGPYRAYFQTGRYNDVINLANVTLNETISEPTLEESLYWRGMAYQALGETGNAIADYQSAVYINPNFSAGWIALSNLGVGP